MLTIRNHWRKNIARDCIRFDINLSVEKRSEGRDKQYSERRKNTRSYSKGCKKRKHWMNELLRLQCKDIERNLLPFRRIGEVKEDLNRNQKSGRPKSYRSVHDKATGNI